MASKLKEKHLDLPDKHRRAKRFTASFLIVLFLLWCTRIFSDVGNRAKLVPQFHHLSDIKGKKNIIMMVTDGTGPASINMARSYRQFRDKLPYGNTLNIDEYFIGSSRTRSNSSLITDSAAGATVFSCGLKTYNGAIGVDPFKTPRGTILEALKLKGYKTGLVVTTSVTDATPAAFNSHVDYRFMQSLIANQQLGFNTTLGRVTDLMIGGGRCFYLPGDSAGGCRDDDRNLVDEAKELGFSVATNKEEFDTFKLGKNVTLPMLSLLASYNIPFDLDRDESKYPSLEEEAKTALTALSKATENSDEGFFLMIEGSRIDHAGHENDPAAQVREVLAYDKAFQAVIDFADSTDVPTYIISTSDHETGGLDVGRQVTKSYPEYVWKPEVLDSVTHSGEYLSSEMLDYEEALESDQMATEEEKLTRLKAFIEVVIFRAGLGIFDYKRSDVSKLLKLKTFALVENYLNEMVSVRSQIGWSTHGHTAVDVNIYGYANTEAGKKFMLDNLLGNHENIEVGKFWQKLTGSDLDKVTEMLKGTPHRPVSDDSMHVATNLEDIKSGFTYHSIDIPEFKF